MCSRLKIDIGFFKIFVKILAEGLSQIKGREIRKSCLIIDNVLFFWSRSTMELRSMHLLSPARKCNPLLAGWISNNVNFPYSSDDKEYICSTVSNLWVADGPISFLYKKKIAQKSLGFLICDNLKSSFFSAFLESPYLSVSVELCSWECCLEICFEIWRTEMNFGFYDYW